MNKSYLNKGDGKWCNYSALEGILVHEIKLQ